MWYFNNPSESLHCSPEQVEGYFAGTCSDGSVSALLSLLPIPAKSFSQDNATGCSLPSPSGMTSEPSTGNLGGATSMSSAEVSRVRTSALPERATASMENEADCGPKWPGSLARYNPGSRSWRTAQCSLLGGLTEYSETFPRWGTVQGTASLERITRERRTNETEYGSYQKDCEAGQLPYKANSSEIVCDVRMQDGETALCVWSVGGCSTLYEAEVLFTEMQGCVRGEGGGQRESISLPGKAYAKAAMRAMRIAEQVASSSHRQRCIEQHADELADALRELSQHVALERQEGQWKLNIAWELSEQPTPVLRIEGKGSGYWPTPLANDWSSPKRNTPLKGGLPLREVVANTPSGNWPTPTCADAFTDKLKSDQQKDGSMHSVNLSQAVKMWPTPVRSDHHTRRKTVNWAGSDLVSTVTEVEELAGNTQPKSGGQLNPDWVELLMGWPRGWSAIGDQDGRTAFRAWLRASQIASIASRPSATDKSQPPPPLPGIPSTNGSNADAA